MNLREKTLSENILFTGNIITVHLDEVQLPNGKTATAGYALPPLMTMTSFFLFGSIVIPMERCCLNCLLVSFPPVKTRWNAEKESCRKRPEQ